MTDPKPSGAAAASRDGPQGGEPLLDGIEALEVTTPRTAACLLRRGRVGDGPVVVLVHGNLSSSRFYEELMRVLPGSWCCLAPDMRGYGRSAPDPVDATRGMRAFSDDLAALLDDPALGLGGGEVHLVGWSLGGGVVMQYALDHRERVASVVLLASMSPYGFCGTRDVEGALCYEDAAGSGAGIVNPALLEKLREGDRGDDRFAARTVMRTLYYKPPFVPAPDREEVYVTEFLRTAVGDDSYPGTVETSPHWPGVAPGRRGSANAMSPRYVDLSGFSDVVRERPVLWVHGADDAIVSDRSRSDPGYLGQTGVLPGWPGPEFPPQPMVSQLRAVLERGKDAGGRFEELLLADCGHSPHLEHPDTVREALVAFVEKADRRGGR